MKNWIMVAALAATACACPSHAQDADSGDSDLPPVRVLAIPTSEQAQPGPVIPATPGDIDPDLIELASRIVEIGMPEDRREEMFFAAMDATMDQLRTSLEDQLPQDDPGAAAVFDEWVADVVIMSKETLRSHIPALMQGLTIAYARTFDEQQLQDILAFASTPTGQEYLVRSSEMMADPAFAEANVGYMRAIHSMRGALIQDLARRLQDYFENQEESKVS